MRQLKIPLKWKQLTEKDIHQFIEQGYIIVRGVFPRELADHIIPMVWAELDIDPDDPSTWTSSMVMLRKVFPFPQIFTQRYIGAVDDLCGQGRWEATRDVGHWPILFSGFANPPWRPPKKGWHIDIDSHVNSPGLGLFCVELFTDIKPGGGGTAVRVGSHRYTARIFAETEPGRLTPCELELRSIASTRYLPVVEVTGRAGDVIMMHPFTVHASSPNTSDRVRIAAVKLIGLYEPMNLKRQDIVDYSPVERAIVDALTEKPTSLTRIGIIE
jgi:phytanoyl-CoA dioxygenase PhyH